MYNLEQITSNESVRNIIDDIDDLKLFRFETMYNVGDLVYFSGWHTQSNHDIKRCILQHFSEFFIEDAWETVGRIESTVDGMRLV